MKMMLAMYVFSGALLVLVAIPLMQRRIGPNGIYGFRVPKTINNPEIWYKMNQYSGTHLFWIGIGTILIAVAGYFLPQLNVGSYATLCAVFVLGALAVSLIFSLRLLNRL